MTVGAQVDKAVLDASLAQVARQYIAATLRGADLADWVSRENIDVAKLQAAPFGYSAAEAQLVLDIIAGLDDVAKVFRGVASTQALPFNFRTKTKKAAGIFD